MQWYTLPIINVIRIDTYADSSSRLTIKNYCDYWRLEREMAPDFIKDLHLLPAEFTAKRNILKKVTLTFMLGSLSMFSAVASAKLVSIFDNLKTIPSAGVPHYSELLFYFQSFPSSMDPFHSSFSVFVLSFFCSSSLPHLNFWMCSTRWGENLSKSTKPGTRTSSSKSGHGGGGKLS